MAKDTSADYDDMIGYSNDEVKPGSLVGFIDGEDELSVEDAWKLHWIDMPEYQNTDNGKVKKQIMVNFRNEEDMQAFAQHLGVYIGPKTKSIYYPIEDKEKNGLMRWIDDADA